MIGKEVSLHFLSPQCFMQIQQISSKKRKFLLKKEMEEVKSLIQTKHRMVSQCPVSADKIISGMEMVISP